MKVELTGTKEFDVKILEVQANVRYWEDAEIDGVEDTNGDLTPCRKGDLFCPRIKVETGEIVNWKKGKKAKIHFKVCDEGTYILKDAENNIIHRQESYVPEMLCPAGDGYGDYIIMSVDENGMIENFKVDFDGMLERDFNNQD